MGTRASKLVEVVVIDPAYVPADNKVQVAASAAPGGGRLSGGTLTVTANGSASHGFNGCPANCAGDEDNSAITGYSWDWGDGTAASPDTDTPHDFTTTGSFAVELTVTNATNSASDSTIITVRVSPVAATLVKNPGLLVSASIGDPQYLDPAIDYETSGGGIIKNVYARLVTRR